MRHMYDNDGNLIYAGAVRASARWKPSGTRSERYYRERKPRKDRVTVQVEIQFAKTEHQERIAAILASSKWNHNYNEH